MLKMNQKYMKLEEHFEDVRIYFYVCDYKDTFEAYEEDWNCDDDIYTMIGQYMEVAREGYRNFISQDEFNHCFYEYNPQEVKYILDTERMIAYNKIQNIKHNNTNYVYLENKFTKDIMTQEVFNKNCKQVKEE